MNLFDPDYRPTARDSRIASRAFKQALDNANSPTPSFDPFLASLLDEDVDPWSEGEIQA